MEIYQALKEDHRNLIHILERLEGTSGDASKLRRDLLEDLYVELSSHASAEEEFFLGLLKETEETQAPALHASDGLKDALSALKELQSIVADDDHWEKKFANLKDIIEDHIREDEEKVIPQAQKLMNANEAEVLGEQFDNLKDEIVQRSQMH